MPNFTAHFVTSGLVGLGTGFWLTHLGFPPQTTFLAAGAALTGGLIPDLDSDQSHPLKMAAALTGLAVALITVEWLTTRGLPFRLGLSWNLQRPWPVILALPAALVSYFIFTALTRTLFCRLTRHRGLLHSLAVPFLIAGFWALALADRGLESSLAVGAAAAAGVFSHLLLDALVSRSLGPLKLYSTNKIQSLLLWLLTSGVAMAWFAQAHAASKTFKLFRIG